MREAYRLWRPTPLIRADRLEQALGLKAARIFYKYEGVSPAGSHKPNTAVAQAYYNERTGASASSPRPAPASGARRWPSRPLFGLEFHVYMVKHLVRAEAVPPRR